MQRRLATITISGAVLAFLAAATPNARACSVPGLPSMRPAIVLPSSLFAPATPKPAGAPVSIVGLWHVKFYSEGFLTDDAFDAWHSDGTEILNDFTDPIEDNVCLGVWSQSGETYRLRHPSWTFDTGGNLTGIAVIAELVTLAADGNSYSGTYSINLFDTAGNPVGTYQGTLKAERITAN